MAEKQKQAYPTYVVCRVNPAGEPSLHPLTTRAAQTQKKAIDAALEDLPAGERTGQFAAFLLRSYREFRYRTEETVTTTADESPRNFGSATSDSAASDITSEPIATGG